MLLEPQPCELLQLADLPVGRCSSRAASVVWQPLLPVVEVKPLQHFDVQALFHHCQHVHHRHAAIRVGVWLQTGEAADSFRQRRGCSLRRQKQWGNWVLKQQQALHTTQQWGSWVLEQQQAFQSCTTSVSCRATTLQHSAFSVCV